MSAPTGGAPRRLVRSVVGALVTMLAGRDHADAMLGDLDEEAAARSGGALLRGFWYAREASSLVAGLVVERARGALGGAGAHWAGAGWDELRTAFRGIRRRPGGPALVALTMAVALTGVTTVFSLVHAAWLRDLPWDDDRALVRVFSAYGGLDGATSRTAVAPEVLRSVVDASPALVGAGAWTVGETVHFDTGEKTVRLDAPRVTHGLFGLLGVEAERGGCSRRRRKRRAPTPSSSSPTPSGGRPSVATTTLWDAPCCSTALRIGSWAWFPRPPRRSSRTCGARWPSDPNGTSTGASAGRCSTWSGASRRGPTPPRRPAR